MADYWKSNERKYCDFCKCWLSDNKVSIQFHENGKRHKMNVEKRISQISKNVTKSEMEKKKMEAEMRKIDEAAMRAYTMDIHGRGDMTARSIGVVMEASTSSTVSHTNTLPTSRNGKQVDPLRLPGSDDEDKSNQVMVKKVDSEDVPNASLWVEGKSDEGYTYYWNVKTNESVWQAPKEGFLSWEEYQRINDLALKQQDMQQATEAKKFRENANEAVARYNREKLKVFRKPESVEEKKAKEERKQQFQTQQESEATRIGSWQVVTERPEPAPVDLELPEVEYTYVPQVVSNTPTEPPVKRFKEKTIESLDVALDEEGTTSTGFKKRKFAAKGNARKRLADD